MHRIIAALLRFIPLAGIALAGLLWTTAAGAAGPDTSSRLSFEYPYLHRPCGFSTTVSAVQVRALDTSVDYLVYGAQWPRKSVFWDISGTGTSVWSEYDPTPVVVIGPWSGASSYEIVIPAPAVASGIEHFGYAVAVHGSRVAISSRRNFTWSVLGYDESLCTTEQFTSIGAGQIYLYQLAAGVATAERTIVHGSLDDHFGAAIDLDAAHLLAGRPGAAPGAADVFDPSTGVRITTLTSPGANDDFGTAVALADDLAVIAAPLANAVYVYRHDGAGNWNPAGSLTSPGSGSDFGLSIDADGERIIVGAPGIDKAYIFEDDGDALWPVAATLTGTANTDFGHAVAITGEAAFVGAPKLGLVIPRTGEVARFERGDGSWPLVSTTASRAPRDGDKYGVRVSASTTLLATVENAAGSTYEEVNVHTAPGLVWDPDSDGILDAVDNCPGVANADQLDTDSDGQGNACDDDMDGDGLSNADEALAGTDPLDRDSDDDRVRDGTEVANGTNPLDPDTDGDTLRDDVDPDPINADTDLDGLNDIDEIALGTDPNNPDTDGDGQNDAVDPWPLISGNDWVSVHSFDANATAGAIGDDLLVTIEGINGLHTRAYVNDEWVDVANPVLPGVADNKVDMIDVHLHRALFVKEGAFFSYEFHVADYDPVSGWSYIGSASIGAALGGLADIRKIAIAEDTIAVVAYDNAQWHLLIYKVVGNSIVHETTKPYSSAGVGLATSGGIVFTSDVLAYDSRGAIQIYDPANNYEPVDLVLPEGYSEEPFWQLGLTLTPAARQAALASSFVGGFHVNKDSGSWGLVPITIPVPPDKFRNSRWRSGHSGAFLIRSNDITQVYRGPDDSYVGDIQESRSAYRVLTTNGRDIAIVGYHTGDIDIYRAAQVLPPGC